ncbi:GNAT family N-acetyltransferase [Candidatus Sumerlaeota bacterium]|nr:GNAT family N-acetyltransferase [Candidatus Sumerlaeota bacterium]
MPDLICSLVNLPPIQPLMKRINERGIHLRRANPWEWTPLRQFIVTNFSEKWADETSVAMARQPVSCFVATHEKKIIGFADYECTRRGYFGPTGVLEFHRGSGVGTALLIASLIGLRDMGYTYAIIGGAGPVDFYRKTVGAIVIPFDEGRGIYRLEDDPAFTS